MDGRDEAGDPDDLLGCLIQGPMTRTGEDLSPAHDALFVDVSQDDDRAARCPYP